jgi:uncharacterized protein
MLERDRYPAGVPCWIDVLQPDVGATMAFYGELFDWDFEVRTPAGAPTAYAYARKDGLLVAGIGGPATAGDGTSGWTSYIWVDSADDTAAAVAAAGGQVLTLPLDIPGAGRMAVCADPSGAVFGLWQATEHRGAELVNAPGSWNFSDLTPRDASEAEKFYGTVFGWECNPFEMSAGEKAAIWRVPGYGAFLAARDPELYERQADAQAPDGFADAVAILNPEPTGHGSGRWNVTFAVADADASFSRALSLGATVVAPLFDTMYTRMGTVADPQGAQLTLSEYRPPATT